MLKGLVFRYKACTLVVGLLMMACTPNRYRIMGDDGNQWFLMEFIGLQAENRVIGFKPLIVVDEQVYRHNVELKNEFLQFTRADIAYIEVVPKDKALKRFGDDGKKGAIVLTLKQ